jgi:CRP/FNR family transcriptional regulator, cyclic AMP receptor protein
MMALRDHGRCLHLSSLFRGRLCDQLMTLPARRLEQGEIVYRTGDRAESIHFVRKGLVQASAFSESGSELILGLYPSGQILGELCFCDRTRREQATAIEPSEIVELSFEALVAHLGKSQEAMHEFLTMVCERLASAHEQVLAFAFDETLQRLARALLRLSEELGAPTHDGVEIGRDFTQADLARMIAASREAVSSSLKRLREIGVVHYTRKGRLTVKSEALRAYLGIRD